MRNRAPKHFAVVFLTMVSGASLLPLTILAEGIAVERSGPEVATERPAVTAHVAIETQGPHKLAIAVDRFDGLAAPDGWLDELVVLVSAEPIEPFSDEGLALLRIEARQAVVVLPESRRILLFSLNDATAPTAPEGSQGLTPYVIDQGAALVTHRPAERQTLEAALAAEQGRLRADLGGPPHRTASELTPVTQDEPDTEGGGGELCGSSCSKACTDGSSCSTACNSSQCAECSCPANCYCRNRS